MSRSTLILLGLLLAVVPAGGTSFVLMSDEVLHEQAEVIAQVSVLSSSPAPVEGPPSTDYLVVLERSLKGSPAGTTFVVRVAGGTAPDGWELFVEGAPRFRNDQRALLFLTSRSDGTYGILHMMLGAFHGIERDGKLLAVRDFSEAEQLGFAPGAIPEIARDFDGFSDWLADRSEGVHAEADYFESTYQISELLTEPQFVLIKPFRRFFEFDTGASVAWRHNTKKSLSGSKKILKKSLKTWNKAKTCNKIRLKYSGTTRASGNLNSFDNVNALTWEDPNNVSAGSYNCSSGGVIAFASGWFSRGQTQKYTVPKCSQAAPEAAAKAAKTKKALILFGADMVTNDGAKCFLQNKTARWAVFTHELGHTLGLGHSCGDSASGSCNSAAKNNALMNAFYQSGRNGNLNGYDQSQINKLY